MTDNNLTVFYGTKDVAECLHCSLPTARQLFHRADFPALKIGKNLKVSKDAFEEWAKERHI
jgi:excisionase family DNA binding protein